MRPLSMAGMVIDLAVPAAPSRIPVLGSGVIAEVGEPGSTRVLASEARKNHLPVVLVQPHDVGVELLARSAVDQIDGQRCRRRERRRRLPGSRTQRRGRRERGAPEQGSAGEHVRLQ